ncbi:MAG: FAD-dependent oxidoreductase [Bacteroidetes bacterium]|nr:FAD-dependent oxidoreductase [Bacteroidota bacterium]
MTTINRLLRECKSSASKHVVIIGNGISGITCARNVRKNSTACITVISSETDHHFSRTALMYIYIGHMRFQDTKPYEDSFWVKNKIDILNRFVSKVNTDEKMLTFSNGESLTYDVLVIATGSKSNKFGWPGQDLHGVQGLYSYQDLQLMEQNTKDVNHAVVVGGGLIGVEMAEMLKSRNIGVSFLVREQHFWDAVLPMEEAVLIERHILEHNINLRLGTELKEIISDERGKVKSIITSKGESIKCEFVGLTVGVSPNILFLKDSGINTDRGVVVNEFFETNIEDVFAIGDCAQFEKSINGRRQLEQVWYTGKMHGETLAHSISGVKTAYNPGHWFNSAKFFDIEYQTYGNVPTNYSEQLASFYWEHPTKKICLRIAYNKQTNILIGVNAFGIRLRHQIIDKWLSEERTIDYVIENLAGANFDPEFFIKYENDIADSYKFRKQKSILSN